MTISILNWIMALIALLAVIGLMVFPILTLIFAIKEGGITPQTGQKKSWKYTKRFGILTGISFLGMVVILVLWGLFVYLVRT